MPSHKYSPSSRPPVRRQFGRRLRRCAVVALCALGIARGNALSVAELLSDPKMNAKRFASYFEDFRYVIGPFDVQDPEQFLQRRVGDCIDYAVLADYVLGRRGFSTRLIRVEMVGKNTGHAVCYVTENRAYLDYNNRNYFFNLTRSGASIREIAIKVADSLEANWTFAQEFTFDYKSFVKRAIFTVVKTQPPAMDPDRNAEAVARRKSNT